MKDILKIVAAMALYGFIVQPVVYIVFSPIVSVFISHAQPAHQFHKPTTEVSHGI